MYTHTHTHTRRQCLCCIRFSKTIKKSSDSKLGVCVCGRAKVEGGECGTTHTHFSHTHFSLSHTHTHITRMHTRMHTQTHADTHTHTHTHTPTLTHTGRTLVCNRCLTRASVPLSCRLTMQPTSSILFRYFNSACNVSLM